MFLSEEEGQSKLQSGSFISSSMWIDIMICLLPILSFNKATAESKLASIKVEPCTALLADPSNQIIELINL